MFSAVMSVALEGVEHKSFPKLEEKQEEEEPEQLNSVVGFMAAYSPELVTVELLWSPVEGEGITYKVYRKEENEAAFKLLAEIADTEYDDMAILPDQTFTYYITAYQASTKLESEPSEQLTITITDGMEVPPPLGEEEGEGEGEEWPPIESEEPPIEVIPPGESPSQSPSPSGPTSPDPIETPSVPPTDNSTETPVEPPAAPPSDSVDGEDIVDILNLEGSVVP